MKRRVGAKLIPQDGIKVPRGGQRWGRKTNSNYNAGSRAMYWNLKVKRMGDWEHNNPEDLFRGTFHHQNSLCGQFGLSTSFHCALCGDFPVAWFR